MRQGNMWPEVWVFRYVTEGTFDAYLFQTVETKQKFISQSMASKNLARCAEDVDEVALSFAEVKMLVTGDPQFKEMMELDMKISKLRVLKQSYLNQQYYLEDNIKKWIPERMNTLQRHISEYTQDAKLYLQHSEDAENKFSGIELGGSFYTEKADAGKMLLTICKQNIERKGIQIGSYKGFAMISEYSYIDNSFRLKLLGRGEYTVEIGDDIYGNFTRIENRLARISDKAESAKAELKEYEVQLELAKEQFGKPFDHEEELAELEERMSELTAELDIDDSDMIIEEVPEKTKVQEYER